MADNRPSYFDAVLGGEAAPPVAGVVLRGFEGVKNSLKSSNVKVRTTALSSALNYGDAGLDLVIEALHDSSQQVQRLAKRLLKRRGGVRGKQALLDYNPLLYFTRLEDWKIKDYDPEIGIEKPDVNAYIFREDCELDGWPYQYIKESVYNALENFCQDDRIDELQALLCQIEVEAIFDIASLIAVKDKLKNLRALFIGSREDSQFKLSWSLLTDISPILKAYPKLEVLQMRGYWDEDNIDNIFTPLKHSNLKTLIIETGNGINYRIVQQISKLELSALEYFELWRIPLKKYNQQSVTSIISGKSFPTLKYLGLPSSDCSDELAKIIVNSGIPEQLKVLNLSMGTLTDEGAKLLLNSPLINKLHTLNISGNVLSTEMTQRLSKLNCRVIAEPQFENNYRHNALEADYYNALHE